MTTTQTQTTTTPTLILPQFTSREEYLTYRQTWKAIYRQRSLDIRALKLAVKNGMRRGIDISAEQHRLRAEQEQARLMLEELAGYRAMARAISRARKEAHANLATA